MSKLISHRVSDTRFTMTLPPALILGTILMLMLILTACGSQPNPVTDAITSSSPLAGQGSVSQSQATLQVTTTVVKATTVPMVATSVVNTGIIGTPQVNNPTLKGGTTTSTSGQLEACNLVTQSEADEALGNPSSVKKSVSAAAGFSECDYTVKNGNEEVRIELATKDANRLFTSNKSEDGSVEVAGLGDRAFKYSQNEGTTLFLVVQTGNNLCRIKLENLADSDKQATALMKKAIERLIK